MDSIFTFQFIVLSLLEGYVASIWMRWQNFESCTKFNFLWDFHVAGLFVFAVHIYLTPGCILLTFDLFSQFLKIILYMFWKISAKMSLCMHESFRLLSKYPSELIGFWMWPQSQSPCVQLITSPIFEDNWAGGNYGEGDTGHEQHEQMNCMSFMSRPLSPAFPRASDIPLHSAPHTM